MALSKSAQKVLLLSANPTNTDRLRVEAESREIEICLQKSTQRDYFALVDKGAIRIDDLQLVLLQEVPRIVHFSGHGAGLDGLVLENDEGKWELVPNAALSALFRILQNGIDCVVLNACYSQIQAEAIVQYVPYVLGMTQQIGDEAAIVFAKGFYEAVFEGETIVKAFELGKNRLELKGILQAHIPVLLQKSRQSVSLFTPDSSTVILEEPEGAVRMGSNFYIARSPQEEQAYKAIDEPHALLRIKSPQRMGKSSMLMRVLEKVRCQGNRTTWLDLHKCDRRFLENTDSFLQWFCAVIGRDLGIKVRPRDEWDDVFGANSNCSEFFENHFLQEPLVIAIDNLDRIFAYEAIDVDFCGLLRAWHEAGKSQPIWAQLRLVLAYSMESFIPRDINQSPFNVGTAIPLDEFTLEQMTILIERHGLDPDIIRPSLVSWFGGHPYLVRDVLYRISKGSLSLSELIRLAPTELSPFGSHLQRRLTQLEQEPSLKGAVKQLVQSEIPLRFDTTTIVRLDSMGLIKRIENGVLLRNKLYRVYFNDRLS